jgi:hypothetical protein
VQHDYMIEALATNRSDNSLYIRLATRRARCRQNFADAQVSHLFSKVVVENSIAVAQQVARKLGEGKSLPQLLSGPLRGWMDGNIEV